jgi:hypothetical protein
LQVVAELTLESLNKKTRVLFNLFEFTWLFLKHVYKVFNKMLVRGKVLT